MVNDWSSEFVWPHGFGDEYAISAFKDAIPWNVGRDFVSGTAKHLYENLSLKKPKLTIDSLIYHEKQLQILMPAIGYGLSFPLSEHEILRNCVSVYTEWLTALLKDAKPNIPAPILKYPNHYASIIINHFYYLFVPRNNQAVDEINRQALLCHRVLRTLQDVAKNSTYLNEETWQTLLIFLLHINSALLSPPAVKNDAGEQLGDRVLSVLFETWLMSCAKCFPPPPLWNVLKESCQRWRHRSGLVEQWNRMTEALTTKLLYFMYGSKFNVGDRTDDEASIVPNEMTKHCVAQVWFRMLHIIGNPVDLCRQEVISKTPAFLKYAITSELVIEPYQHPCLEQLPNIFYSAMNGISNLVDAFIACIESVEAKGRPKINSILHLFGPWLFEAALMQFEHHSILGRESSTSSASSSMTQVGSASSQRRATVGAHDAHTLLQSSSSDKRSASSQFELGKAKAIGALCRVFCSKKTGEEVLPVYLARFYLALKQGLQLQAGEENLTEDESGAMTCGETAAAILLNATNLFKIDLDGVAILIPSFIPVLSLILIDNRNFSNVPVLRSSSLSNISHSNGVNTQMATSGTSSLLRRSAIHILLSLLPLPLHFQGMHLKDLSVSSNETTSLSSLRSQLVNMISGALRVETDATNIQMLLAGLIFSVEDSKLYESLNDVTHDNDDDITCRNDDEAAAVLVDDKNSTGISSAAVSDTMSSLGTECASDSLSNTHDQVRSDIHTSASSEHANVVSSDVTDNAFNFVTAPPFLPSFPPQDNAHGLYVRAIYLVSHCLMSSWTKDVNVSLAALELLSNLAQMDFKDQESDECMCAVKWLCDYIVHQCSRPPQAHSKDLHSMIVAAFNCVNVWLLSHVHLMQDQQTLNTVLEVIELGISGSKSQGKSGDLPKYKHEKESKPVSMRVRDAAEALLSCVLSQVGSFPTNGGIESLSTLLDEVSLLQHCNSYSATVPLTRESAAQHFRYFVTQNSILLALLEQPLVNHEDPQPTVTLLIRGPFGRFAWTLQLRHLPRQKASNKHCPSNPGRPLSLYDGGNKTPLQFKHFPDSIQRIAICKADKSIPTMDQIIASDQKTMNDHEKLSRIIDQQVQFEERELYSTKIKNRSKDSSDDHATECIPPPTCHEFQTARLLLSHLGLLSVDNSQGKTDDTTCTNDLIALDASDVSFIKDVTENLDATNSRTVDTVHIFYVRAGCTSPDLVLQNAENGVDDGIHAHFYEFVHGLGWPVDVDRHPGWSGHISTSFKVPPNSQQASTGNATQTNKTKFDENKIIYWADALLELAFVVPSSSSLRSLQQHIQQHSLDEHANERLSGLFAQTGGSLQGSEMSDSLSNVDCEQEASSLTSQTSQHTPCSGGSDLKSRRLGRQISSHSCTGRRFFVVWLESLEDMHSFPKESFINMTSSSRTDSELRNNKTVHITTLFIHPLSSGLFKIHLQGQINKLNLAGPLVDGQIISRRVLGKLVRQTAINMCKRMRLENDCYQPPHVRRKFRIQDLAKKYKSEMSKPDFYTHLFTNPLN